MKAKKQTAEQEREDRIRHEMGSCIHFRGIQHDTCKAEINMRELVGGPELGWAARLPCLLMDAEKCTVVCDSRKLPTREEAEAEILRDDLRSKKIFKAFTAAHEDAFKKGLKKDHGGQDSMPCPTECGGVLRYSVASVNGHMHAVCGTKDCVSWME